MPEVTGYDLNVNAKSPKIPDAFLPPGTWPISFSLVMPFAAGPVPMEAEVGFEASAGASLGLSGSIKKWVIRQISLLKELVMRRL